MKIYFQKGNYRVVQTIGRFMNIRMELQKSYVYYDINKYTNKLERKVGWSTVMVHSDNERSLEYFKEYITKYSNECTNEKLTPFSAFNDLT